MIKVIPLTENESLAITQYRKHLWKIANIPLTFRETLHRIIMANDEELKMAEKEFDAEE